MTMRMLMLFCYFFSLTVAAEAAEDSSHRQRCVLVVGGAGFIGSQVNKQLLEHGYETIVFDNFSTGNKKAVSGGLLIEGDLANRKLLNSIFQRYKIDAVMHFAAFIDVEESCNNPAIYYRNNLCNTLNLLEAMVENKIEVIIFSSSAAIFGTLENGIASERDRCLPLNPYGRTKLFVEQLLRDFAAAYPLRYCALRYFNAAGGDPDGVIKNFKNKESNLIPVALRCYRENREITIFGSDYPTRDGTCVRDYIHISDLANAHILAMDQLFEGKASTEYNLGSGKGYSVLEVLKAIEIVTGKSLKIKYGARRAGDAPCLIANPQKAERELGWKPQHSLNEMIEHALKALPFP